MKKGVSKGQGVRPDSMYVAGGNNFFYLSIVALFFSYIVYVSKLMLVFVYVQMHSVCLSVQTQVYSYNEMNIPGCFYFHPCFWECRKFTGGKFQIVGPDTSKDRLQNLERERFGGFFLPSTKAF